MDDKEFMREMKKCFKLKTLYFEQLRLIEDEYVRRYKSNPSEVDNDLWIDAFHYPGSKLLAIKDVEESVKLNHGIFNSRNKKSRRKI